MEALIVRVQYFIFLGTSFLRKLYLKNFNIKNKNNKISQGSAILVSNFAPYVKSLGHEHEKVSCNRF